MQTSYSIDQAVGFEGQLADLSIQDVETGIAEGEILIGKIVNKGTLPTQIKHPLAAADITDEKLVKGLAIHAHDQESKYPAGSGNYSYLDKYSVNVLRKGRAWVKPESVITVGTSTVNVRYAGTGDKGALRGVAVASETAVLPKSKWKTSTTAIGQLAILEIDL